ncbi:MAG: WecB/TagA/CpsF family glycosyltransferase [Vicingaceae bacterium]
MSTTSPNNKRIVSLDVSTLSYSASLAKIVDYAKKREPSYACFANVHMIIEAYDEPHFKEQVNTATLVCADGMPLVKAIQLKYGQTIERVAGMDMMPSLLHEAERAGLSVYFFGSTQETLEKIATKAQDKHPSLQIAGYYSPPFRPLSEEEESEIAKKINDTEANLVFVALGCPKQEKWMARNSKHIKAVLLGVGGAFPVFINEQKRAPKWIRDLSLEWLFRLVQDPKRLFKRYFYTNSKFLLLFLRQYIFKTNS